MTEKDPREDFRAAFSPLLSYTIDPAKFPITIAIGMCLVVVGSPADLPSTRLPYPIRLEINGIRIATA